jgi:hypothetical protein
VTAPATSPQEPQQITPVKRSGLSRKAIIGWILGVLVLLAIVWLLIPRPPGERIREPARIATCKSYLRLIGAACRTYAEDHAGDFPASPSVLVPKYLDGSERLDCQGATHRNLARPHYTYVPGLRADMPDDFIVAYDHLQNHGKRKTGEQAGRNVLFLNGIVHWWHPKDEARLQAKLTAQREAVKKWRGAGNKPKVKLVDDPVEAIRKALPNDWAISKVKKDVHPWHRTKGTGTGTAIYLVEKGRRYGKAQFSAALFIMPPSYEGKLLVPHGVAQTNAPHLVTTAKNGKVYFWGGNRAIKKLLTKALTRTGESK